jgi:hypothetical protein
MVTLRRFTATRDDHVRALARSSSRILQELSRVKAREFGKEPTPILRDLCQFGRGKTPGRRRLKRFDLDQTVVENRCPPHVGQGIAVGELVGILAVAGAGIGGMLRSIVESYADLCATINEKDYVKRLIATFYQEKLRLMRNMRRAPTNAFHEDLAKHFDTDAEQAKVSAELAALGVEPLKIHERFAAGGLQEIYESLYWQLCLQGHNNVSALQGRHIRGTSDEYQIVLLQNNRPSEFAMYFDVLSAVLTDCAIRVHGFLDTKVLPRYEKRVLALRAFRDAVHAEVTTAPAGTT